jgi:hypothetical protein
MSRRRCPNSNAVIFSAKPVQDTYCAHCGRVVRVILVREEPNYTMRLANHYLSAQAMGASDYQRSHVCAGKFQIAP